jgi:hypothetical protein
MQKPNAANMTSKEFMYVTTFGEQDIQQYFKRVNEYYNCERYTFTVNIAWF